MALNAEDAKIIREAIIKFGRGIKKDIATESPFNKTKNGRVVKVTPTGYTVEIENKQYPRVQAINTNQIYLNDIVACCLPNNQMSQMYIIGKLVGRVDNSGGSGGGTASGDVSATASSIAQRDTNANLNATSFSMCTSGTSTMNAKMQYNSTNESIDFIFG